MKAKIRCAMGNGEIEITPGKIIGDVLIVDDEKNVTKVLKAYCEELGVFRNIIVAQDGAIACRKLEMQKFALILLDINMPKKSGLDVIKEIGESTLNLKTDVLIISGMLGKEVLTSAIQMGVKNFLIKPFDHDVFTAKAVEVLKASLSSKKKKVA
jgi:response regulator of citrate/malate metabolism